MQTLQIWHCDVHCVVDLIKKKSSTATVKTNFFRVDDEMRKFSLSPASGKIALIHRSSSLGQLSMMFFVKLFPDVIGTYAEPLDW